MHAKLKQREGDFLRGGLAIGVIVFVVSLSVLAQGCAEVIAPANTDANPEDPGQSTDDPGQSTDDPGQSTDDPGQIVEDPDGSTSWTDIPRLCWPCQSNDDCLLDGDDVGARCMPGEQGMQFCGTSCAVHADCPVGFDCLPTVNADIGDPTGQCVLAEGIICPCTEAAVAAEAATTCTKTGASPGATEPETEPNQCDGVASCTVVDEGPGPCEPVDPPVELCNQQDDNCDGQIDETFPFLGEACDSDDADDCLNGIYNCSPDGITLICENDENVLESCGNNQDDNCNGISDEDEEDAEGCVVYVLDADEDGFGTNVEAEESSKCLCQPQAPYKAPLDLATDCDDSNPNIHPDATEDCETSADDNCNGNINDADAIGCSSWYKDSDGDGHGSTTSSCLCSAMAPYTATLSNDCDDGKASVHPGATEVCNGINDDCDQLTDEAGATGCTTYYKDLDGDGYGQDFSPRCLCTPGVCVELNGSCPYYTATVGGDCFDGSSPSSIGANINPGVTAWQSDGYTISGSVSFDWNCDGVESRRWTDFGVCEAPCVADEGWQGGVPSCGSPGNWLIACLSLNFVSCNPYFQNPPKVQECR